MVKKLSILGSSISLDVLILILVIGGLIALFLFCEQWHAWNKKPTLLGSSIEGYTNTLSPAPVQSTHPKSGQNRIYAWNDKAWSQDVLNQKNYNSSDWYKHLEGNIGGSLPLPSGQLDIMYDNKFHPKCCPSEYSSSTGCACLSVEQAKYLTSRAGNRFSEQDLKSGNTCSFNNF